MVDSLSKPQFQRQLATSFKTTITYSLLITILKDDAMKVTFRYIVLETTTTKPCKVKTSFMEEAIKKW
jgi:hypothetical protein